MKISASLAMWMCVVFALVCFSVAFSVFSALQGMTSVEDREMSQGYAWFWTFLGLVASIFGALSWMMKTGRLAPIEE
jgi:hypothetical protein